MFQVAGFAIMGCWDGSPEPADMIVIRLAPQPDTVNLFGWGDHATTQQRLEAIKQDVKPGMRVVDIGTGTGIQAIAAPKLGATVTAFESDQRVREYAQTMFQLNHVNVQLLGKWPEAWDGQGFDLVVANIGALIVPTAGRVIGGDS